MYEYFSLIGEFNISYWDKVSLYLFGIVLIILGIFAITTTLLALLDRAGLLDRIFDEKKQEETPEIEPVNKEILNEEQILKRDLRWTCEYCGQINEDEALRCISCDSIRRENKIIKKSKIKAEPEVANETFKPKTDGKIDTVVIKEKTVITPNSKTRYRQKIAKDLH